MPQGTCSVDGCDRAASKRGMCGSHYQRWWKTGDATTPVRRVRGTNRERFDRWTNRDGPDGCWLWLGALDKRGYGRMPKAPRGGGEMAHRWAYKHFVGAIPLRLVLDHLCRNPSCVNPAHLEPVSNYENVVTRGVSSASAVNARKTHCNYGHEFTPENTYTYPTGRYCKQCQKRRTAESKARRATR